MEDDDQLRERFERVFHEHHAAVCAYAFRRADRATAQDAVSETFLIAWRRCSELPAEPLPWLLSTARRVLANQRRASDHQRSIERRLATDAVTQTSDPADSLGYASACRAALERLGERDRETLMLLAWEELDRHAAAGAIGCSRATFAVRLHRARHRFRAELAAGGFEAATLDTMEPA
ncbi:MAG TPA: sigma-70 family RNA polymerase sigma factor [Solirubrobacteraceae bacterium]|nr:sigma-70 family RNA polymerase sigma factor [Solirubrobacteraceae bacterium]